MTLRIFCLSLVFLVLSSGFASAQEDELLPELDVYLKLNSDVRLRLQASDTRDGGDPTQLTIGPYVELYLKPLVQLKEVAKFDLDDSKSRPLIFSAGYNYIAAPDSPSTNRIVLMVTSRFPATKPKLLFTDRNRSDLNWSSGDFNWRYRNKLEVERPLTIHSYHPSPYSSVEVYYESQYKKWSTTEIDVGCLFPIRKRFELETYYEHQNNTGKEPNRQINALGLTLNIYLSTK